eukprot:g494.t1
MGKVTSGKYGDKGRRKVKGKSIKTKATGKSVGSKRRLARMGREQKKGHRGIAATYITRSQAVRKLQVSLRDFRRLCILRGIHPRDPKKKANGTNKTYYHVKDIAHLQHEPLLEKFREFKAFMKKVRKSAGRGELESARDMWENRPKYTLHHVVRERYPQFEDALADIEDALCMIHLFANLSTEGFGKSEVTKSCERLCREWQKYVVHTNSLRKSFLSVKGIYFQAEIGSETTTWVVPYRFTQSRPEDVDYKVMNTFLEFYITFLKFVFFKLYSDAGLKYPPTISETADANAAFLSAVTLSKLSDTSSNKIATSDDDDDDDEGDDDINSSSKDSALLQEKLDEKLKTMKKKKKDEENEDEDTTTIELEEAFQDDAQAQALQKKQKELAVYTSLFKGLRFFLNRECPRETFEFVIRSFGGEVGWDAESSPYGYNDGSITHCVVDRPKLRREMLPGREYIQPQWIIDSINAKMLLPTAAYVHGKSLPPHLSPFVNDEEENYVPEYRKKIKDLQVAAGVLTDDEDTKNEENELNDEDKEAKELAKIMMPSKKRKLHDYIMKKRKEKSDEVEKLKSKRRKTSKKKN